MKMEDWGIIQAVLPLPWEGGRERLMHSGHVGIPLSDGEGHGIKVIHCHHYLQLGKYFVTSHSLGNPPCHKYFTTLAKTCLDVVKQCFAFLRAGG